MTTATDIQKQLAEAWESAEVGEAKANDLVIVFSGNIYSVGTAADLNQDGVSPVRILERAKPKAPEWEAVVASNLYDAEHVREVFVRTESGNWEAPTYYLTADELVDPVPLVELPERDALVDAINRGEFVRRAGHKGPAPRGHHEAEAVLELLRGERRA